MIGTALMIIRQNFSQFTAILVQISLALIGEVMFVLQFLHTNIWDKVEKTVRKSTKRYSEVEWTFMSYSSCDFFNFLTDVLTFSLSFSNVYRFCSFFPLILNREARLNKSWKPFFLLTYSLSLSCSKYFS